MIENITYPHTRVRGYAYQLILEWLPNSLAVIKTEECLVSTFKPHVTNNNNCLAEAGTNESHNGDEVSKCFKDVAGLSFVTK